MKKKELLELPALRATKGMLELAAKDELKPIGLLASQRPYVRKGYERGRYLRSKVCGGILKVAIFLPEHLRMGARDAAFEVYIDRQKGQFLTYDRIVKMWRTAKLDCLPWPGDTYNSKENWISKADYRTILQYLGGERGGYEGVLDYQLEMRRDALKRKYKRETAPWDADMAQIPEKPKDWDRWCRKVGIPENYIFYQYSKRGAKTSILEEVVGPQAPMGNPSGAGVGPA